MSAKQPEQKSTQPTMTPFDETGAADVDIAQYEYVSATNLLGVAFVVHGVTRAYVPQFMTPDDDGWRLHVTVSHFDSSRPDDAPAHLYTMTCRPTMPLGRQLAVFADNADEAAKLPLGPVTLDRIGRTFKLLAWQASTF
jgi:hypothetical protein